MTYLKPGLHVQPAGRLEPVLLVGQGTAAQEDTKNGAALAATTLPAKPALHTQPSGTVLPAVLAGQATPAQVDTK